MMDYREIGGEFFEFAPDSEGSLPFSTGTYTSTGRGAITGVLRSIHVEEKIAWLPSYTCYSVIAPFVREGYRVEYYNIQKNLCGNIEEISSIRGKPGVLLYHPYYGFPTSEPLQDMFDALYGQGWHIIADLTHNFLSTLFMDETDSRFHHVCSLRKWMALPDGGWTSLEIPTSGEHDLFCSMRLKATEAKTRYFKKFSNDLKEKEHYLQLYQEAEAIANRDCEPYAISSISRERLRLTNYQVIANKRRENYLTLYRALKGLRHMRPVLSAPSVDEIPMFFPLFVEKARDEFRNALREQRIYCPIHWSVPECVTGINSSTQYLFENIVSIPIDQRYNAIDIERIASSILRIDKEFV